ncbi:hypothetical protein [Pedobacter foliorum]|uniref:hypothetical protein n=1 Tax=Pedobacter foliorum TaxID=2739058 RepID=UPI00156436DD|nr:hypothetical protein [Pedobacter foliorum]NRF40742.1 hypothetical protein [Pedobacter foliorum]
MKNLSKLSLLLLFLLSCVSTQKLYEKGEYDKAYYAAIGDLKKNPSNADALKILPDAYKEASAKFEQDILLAKGGKGKKSEQLAEIYNGYLSLQNMYDAFANSDVKINGFSPQNYDRELNQAALNAAETHYNWGVALLNRNDRVSARKAYNNLKLADNYVPGYKDVIEKKQEAEEAAVTNVLVTKLDQRFGYYSIDGAFFERDILWNLNSIGNSNYYEFYSGSEGQGRRIDQYLEISMNDIWFSNLATNNYSYRVSKKIPVKSDKANGSVSTITVTATINAVRRIINSRASMYYRITDAESRKLIASDRIPAEYTWQSITGKYTGDSRALSAKDWDIVRGSYNNRPDYNDLYHELTRQIMTQFNFKMRDIYR